MYKTICHTLLLKVPDCNEGRTCVRTTARPCSLNCRRRFWTSANARLPLSALRTVSSYNPS